MSKAKNVFGLILFIAAMALGGFAYKLARFWTATPGGASVSQTVFYEVKMSTTPKIIAKDLEKAGVLLDARFFYWYGRLSGKNTKIKAGDYRLTTTMRPGEVMAIITSGISYSTPFTVPEGFNMAQIADALERFRPGSKARFSKLCHDPRAIALLGIQPAPATLEGYLYPDTYFIGRRMTEEEIVRQMLRKYREVFTPVLAARAKEIGMTEHQVVTLASIVEKETGAKQERPLISSVFHNRLRKKMKLQTDPTVIYGIKNYDGNLRKRDLEAYSPYNTYKIPGLPPGPISSPGKEAILAALYPADSNYLFFVSHNDGTHEFTSTYEEHSRAVSRFQLDPKAREGKSWRDLSKPSSTP